MKAPDKIYVTVDKPDRIVETNPEIIGVAWTERDDSCEHIEYIRKDALVEWANDNLLECEASNDDADYGRIDAFKKLIDKLGSL